MPEVKIYTTRFCGYCMRAKQLLKAKNVDYKEIPVDGDREARQRLMAASGQHTVPQVWVGDIHIGGCNELYAADRSGKLDELLCQ